MLNKSTSSSKYVVQSGVTPYPIGFEFQYNGDDTPQIRVTIGAMVAEENVHFVISEDLLNIELIPLEEETPVDPNDYSWMDKWVGMELVIERDIPFVQESDYQLGRISPERIEKDFDLSVMRDQMLDDKISDVHDEFTEAKTELQKSIDDKLPLAGGEVSGDVLFRGAIKLYDKYNRGASFISAPLGGMYIHTDKLTRFYFDDDFYALNLEINEESNLGTESYPWSTAYIKKLNNGGTISIPEKVGTMALLEDLESKADKTELSNYLPLAGGDLVGKVVFDVGGTAGKNTPLIGVETASGAVPLIGAKTDDNGVLRDVAVIPKLLTDTFQAGQIHASFVGTPSNPVTRIHAKKIGTGLIGSLLTIPDGPGTIARLADIPDTYTKEELDAKFAEIPDSVDTYSKAEIDAKLSSVYKFKGSVANVDALPTDAVVGDTYNVEDTGANYAWDGTKWDKLSDTINLSDYATVDYVDDFYLELSGDLAKEKTTRAAEDRQLYNNQIVLRDMLNEKDENDEFIQLTTEAQTAIPAINELNEKKASKEDLSGYLPLSGGTMTGALTIDSGSLGVEYGSKTFLTLKATRLSGKEEIAEIKFGTTGLQFSGTSIYGVGNISPNSSSFSLGDAGAKWVRVFARNLNNGANIAIPTEGGTLARLEDLEGIGGGLSDKLGFNTDAGHLYFKDISNVDDFENLDAIALTADIEFNALSIVNHYLGSLDQGELYRFNDSFFSAGEYTTSKDLGRDEVPWMTTYTVSICAGLGAGLLDLPTEAGTLARVEDIDERIGDISTALTAILGE